jgi:hypothetical protein
MISRVVGDVKGYVPLGRRNRSSFASHSHSLPDDEGIPSIDGDLGRTGHSGFGVPLSTPEPPGDPVPVSLELRTSAFLRPARFQDASDFNFNHSGFRVRSLVSCFIDREAPGFRFHVAGPTLRSAQ